MQITRFISIVLILLLGQTPIVGSAQEDLPLQHEVFDLQASDSQALSLPTDSFIENDRSTLVLSNKVQDQKIILRPQKKEWWIFPLIIFLLFLIGLLQNTNPTRHKYSILHLFITSSNQEKIERFQSVNWFQITQILISCIVIGLLLYVVRPFDLNFTFVSQPYFYIVLLLVVLLTYTIKYFSHYIVGLVLQSENLAVQSVITIGNAHYLLSLILLPFVLFIYYEPILSQRLNIPLISLYVIGVFLLIRFIRLSILYVKHFPYSKIYIILYLCTLEILPVLILVKILN